MTDSVKYVRKVSKHIRCDKKYKAECIQRLKATVDEAEAQDYQSLVEQFGEPSELAKELEEIIGGQKVKSYRIKRIVLVLAAAAVIASALIVFYFYVLKSTQEPVYATEEIPFLISDKIIEEHKRSTNL